MDVVNYRFQPVGEQLGVWDDGAVGLSAKEKGGLIRNGGLIDLQGQGQQQQQQPTETTVNINNKKQQQF